MRNSKWIPSSDENTDLFHPSELYVVSPAVERLFARKVNYVHSKIENHNFRECIGVQREVKMVNFIAEFRRWNSGKAVFSSTYGHVQNIYRYVRDIMVDEAKEVMVDRCIFLLSRSDVLVSQSTKFVDSDTVKGGFYRVKEVCWEDPSNVVEIAKDTYGTRRVLKGFYPDHMKEFFVETLGVPVFPTTQEYLNAIYNLVNRTILPDSNALKKLFRMFYVLGQKSVLPEKVVEVQEWAIPETTQERCEMYRNMENYIDPEMRKTLQSAKNIKSRLIPTNSNIFLPISDQPIICIDHEVQKIYAKDRQIDIAVLDDIARVYREHNLPSHIRRSKEREIESITLYVMMFYRACGMDLLYDLQCPPKINVQVISPGCYFWEDVMHNIVPAIQRFMIVYIADIYDELQKKNFREFLRECEINRCKKLEVVYNLKGREKISIRQFKIACVELSEDMDKASGELSEDKDKAIKELSKDMDKTSGELSEEEDNSKKNSVVYINETFSEGFQQGEAILRELMELFVGKDDKSKEILSDFVLTYTTVLNKETYMRRKRLPPLPLTEVAWMYPKPPDVFPTVVGDDQGCEEGEIEGETKETRYKIGADQSHYVRLTGTEISAKPPRMPALGQISSDPPSPEPISPPEEEVVQNTGSQSGSGVSMSAFVAGAVGAGNTTDVQNQEVSSSGQLDAGNNKRDGDGEAEKKRREERRSRKRRRPDGEQNVSEGNIEDGELSDDDGEVVSEDDHDGGGGERNQRNDGRGDATNTRRDDGRQQQQHRSKRQRTNDWYNDYDTAKRYNALKPSRKFLDMEVVDLNDQYEDLPINHNDVGKDGGEDSRVIDLESIVKENTNRDPGSEIGQIGEGIVFKHLCHQYAVELKNKQIEIEWLNEDEEYGLPYDMKLTFFDNRTPPIVYVEVKTTYIDEKKEFEISSNQVKFAFEQGERYHLYRLSGIRSPKDMKLRRLANLATYLENKTVRLFMVL